MSRSLVILYGSETGCAQDVAETLGRQARHRHFKTKVMAMDDYDKVRKEKEFFFLFLKKGKLNIKVYIEFINRRGIRYFCLFNDRSRGRTY